MQQLNSDQRNLLTRTALKRWGNRDDRNSKLLRLKTRMRCSRSSGKCNYEIRLSFLQHAFIPDECCMSSLFLPFRRKFYNWNSSAPRPVTGNAIHAAGITFQDQSELVLRMKPV